MGYFFAFLSLVITIYWIYRGFRRGLYPALNIFMVFFLPLLITLNYYDVMFKLVAWAAPMSSMAVRETISFIGMYLITFTVFMYFCIWLCVDAMRLGKTVDMIGGGILGVGTGMVCCGVLMMFWFAMPFAEDKFPVDEGEMFYAPHRLTMRMATFVSRRIEGQRQFIGKRFLRDLRYGLPQHPDGGSGVYVSSIPSGCRVFVDTSGFAPYGFLNEIKDRLANPDKEIPPSQQRHNFTERRRSPVFVPTESQSMLVAVLYDDMEDDMPSGFAGRKPEAMFVRDGEVLYSLEKMRDRPIFVKIYRVNRQSGTASVTALFQPKDPSDLPKDPRGHESVNTLLPSRDCFQFNETDAETRILEKAFSERKDSILVQLRMGGKAWFTGTGDKPYVAEVLPGGKVEVREVIEPDLESIKKEYGTRFGS